MPLMLIFAAPNATNGGLLECEERLSFERSSMSACVAQQMTVYRSRLSEVILSSPSALGPSDSSPRSPDHTGSSQNSYPPPESSASLQLDGVELSGTIANSHERRFRRRVGR
eukprot:scaffold7555_cov487-Pinguiococcus_pyrenoidosus.AAC.1